LSLSHGWTGGQYSVFRAALGLYLAIHYAQLLPWGAEIFSNRGVLPDASASPLVFLFPSPLGWFDSPALVTALLAAGVALALLLMLGARDRAAALGLAWLQACLLGRNPLISNPAIPFIGWMLLAHACVPRAAYGAWSARGRTDPRGGWSFPSEIFLAAWVVMSLAYSYSGYYKLLSPSWVDGSALARVLENPLARPGPLREWLLALPPLLLPLATWGALGLELLFAPLALVARVRPWLWLAMVGLHLGLLGLVAFADLTAGMLLLHWFTSDPAWLPGSRPGTTDRVFYDGSCGLCHRAVRFFLAEDRAGSAFRYAPLDSDAARQALGANALRSLPDSIVIATATGEVLTRSAAILHAGERLGGLWRLLAGLARCVPRALRDRVYDWIARNRRRVFARPDAACPLLPPDLRARFDA
jgi:predicted DCC family thiol-disulfide oxidoreductase YuxK